MVGAVIICLICGVMLYVSLFHTIKEKPYILNKHTFEIHNKSCPCLEYMKDCNKKYITKEKRDKLIAEDSHCICERCKSK